VDRLAHHAFDERDDGCLTSKKAFGRRGAEPTGVTVGAIIGEPMDDKTNLPPATTLHEYQLHELADMFPLIEGDEYVALVLDIGRQGPQR
jgi:hypothetical protein